MALLNRTIHGMRRRPNVIRFAAWTLLAVLGAAAGVHAAEPQAQIDELKAAFVFQFANFITWPETAFQDEASPIVIGIVGNEDMAGLLRESVRDKRVNGRPILVRDLSKPQDSPECHIVYLDRGDDKRVTEFLAETRGKPILTVSDDPDFTSEGGIIKLYEQQSKLRIEINVDEVESAHLTVSSKLMSLAKVVRNDS